MKRLLAATALAFNVCGCAVMTAERWPEHGTGGLAELLPVSQATIMNLQQRLESADERGARTYAASDFEEALMMMARLRRECIGGLHVDAANTANLVESRLSLVEKRLAGRAKSNRSVGS